MDIAKEITVINLGRAKEPSKPTWCVGPWELFLSWASPRLAFGLRSKAIWDLQTKAVCDALD